MDLDKLLPALVVAKQNFQSIRKDSIGAFHKNKYASIASILDAIEPALLEQGLIISQSIQENSLVTRLYHVSGQYIESVYLLPGILEIQETAITVASQAIAIQSSVLQTIKDSNSHTSQELTEALLEQFQKTGISLNKAIDIQTSAQKLGSVITYARRYALSSLLGVVADDDSDCQSSTSSQGSVVLRSKLKPVPKTDQSSQAAAQIKEAREAVGLSQSEVVMIMQENFGVDHPKELKPEDLKSLIGLIKASSSEPTTVAV